jgi:hypothetical protein
MTTAESKKNMNFFYLGLFRNASAGGLAGPAEALKRQCFLITVVSTSAAWLPRSTTVTLI